MGTNEHDGEALDDTPADGEPYTDPMKTIGVVGAKSPARPAIPPRTDGSIRHVPNVAPNSRAGSALDELPGVPSPPTHARFTVRIPLIPMSTTFLGYVKYAQTALMWIAGALSVNVGTDGTISLPDPGSAWYAYAIVGLLAAARILTGIAQSRAMADAAKPAPTPAPGL